MEYRLSTVENGFRAIWKVLKQNLQKLNKIESIDFYIYLTIRRPNGRLFFLISSVSAMQERSDHHAVSLPV